MKFNYHQPFEAVGGKMYLKKVDAMPHYDKLLGRRLIHVKMDFRARIEPEDLGDFFDSVNELMKQYSERNKDISTLSKKDVSP